MHYPTHQSAWVCGRQRADCRERASLVKHTTGPPRSVVPGLVKRCLVCVPKTAGRMEAELRRRGVLGPPPVA